MKEIVKGGIIINYNNKFKNRPPQKTIQIIKNFFNNNNLKIEENQIIESISGTWSVHLALLLNNKVIFTSNGKGVTKEYALASGYAELYERFCNKLYHYYNNQVSLITEYLSYEKNKYFLHPKEKVISFHAGLMESKKLYQILSKTNTIDMMEVIFQNQWIGVPFCNLMNDEVKYLDPRLLTILESSTGMSAGNSREEAIIQGLSEQFEHQIKWNFVDLIKNQPLYKINIEKLNNPILQSIITKIKQENDFFLFDASYYYNTPTVFGIVVNKTFNTITLNISSFPVFDIAVERVCTELYQGVISYNNKERTLVPSREKEKSKKDYFWSENTSSFYNISSIPEELFLKEHILCDEPSNIFLIKKEEYSEIEIYNYYLDLVNKNNYSIYYYDCSLDKNIYALKIYVEEIINMSNVYLVPIGEKVKRAILLNNEIFNNYIFSNSISLELIEELNLIYHNLTDFEKSSFLRFNKRSVAFEIFDACSYNDYLILLDSILYNDFYLTGNQVFSLFKKSYVDWKIKMAYLNDNNYTQEEIQKILSYFNLQLTKEDITFYKDKTYLLNEIIFKNINKLYNSEDYKQYIELFINLKPVNLNI